MTNSNASIAHLDRQVTNTTPGVTSDYSNPTTTWTLPYSVAPDGSQGVLTICRTDTNVWFGDALQPVNAGVTITRPAANQIAVSGAGDLTAVAVLIGLLYPMTWELSTIYFRNQKGGVDQRGRLRLGYIEFSYEPTTDFTVVVTPQGRSSYSYVFHDPTAQQFQAPADLEIMPFRVPIQCRNEDATIQIQNNTPGSTRLVGFDWEAMLVVRSRAE
jgi:hypothetical protein